MHIGPAYEISIYLPVNFYYELKKLDDKKRWAI